MAKVKSFYWTYQNGYTRFYKNYAEASRALGISKELVRWYASRGIHSEADKQTKLAWQWKKPKKTGDSSKRKKLSRDN